MSWIKEIKYEEADANLKNIYNRIKGPANSIDNILSAHSLRPHTLIGHMSLYKNVIHNSNNTLPKWYLEALGVYVSRLNNCSYCVQHHSAGMKRLINDEVRSQAIIVGIESGKFENCFEARFSEGMLYAEKLTLHSKNITEDDVLKLRGVGFSDGEILEINQVVSYFNYANRTVIGLGVNLNGDILGHSPNNSADANDWTHS